MGEAMARKQSDMGVANLASQGVWQSLFAKALTLIDEIEKHGTKDLFWTFGGGTVLMLRYGHRMSKDIDIFVPDPQSFGYISPRLSDVAEGLTTDYVEAASYVKLFFKEGEIDFVAAPNLTTPGYVVKTIMGRKVRLETSAEIIAKKLWHRGDKITGRDIFDYALVAQKEPESLMAVSEFLIRHADAVLESLKVRSVPLRIQFEAIETLEFNPAFEDACGLLADGLSEMVSRSKGVRKKSK
jgi:hypothetical protein